MSLQLIDRMAGPGPVDGEPGTRDGRIDTFLARGTTRIVARGSELGRGEATLAAVPFRELEAAPTRLVEGRLVSTELGDFGAAQLVDRGLGTSRSRGRGGGRYLADLRIWQNGSWLIAG